MLSRSIYEEIRLNFFKIIFEETTIWLFLGDFCTGLSHQNKFSMILYSFIRYNNLNRLTNKLKNTRVWKLSSFRIF